MPTLKIETLLNIKLESKGAYDPAYTDQPFTDQMLYGDRKYYKATCTSGGEDFNFSGWSFRFDVATDVALPVASEVAYSDNSKFSVSSNELSWNASTTTTEFQAVAEALDIGKRTPALACLWGMPSGGTEWQLVASWPVNLYGSVGPQNEAAPEEVDSPATVGDLDGRIASGVVITKDSDGRAVITVDGVERMRL